MRVVDQETGAAKASVAQALVIKTGGEPLEKDDLLEGLAKDLAALHGQGVKIIIVHGGKTQIERKVAEADEQPEYIEGLRVTDEATLSLMEAVYKKTAARFSDVFKKHGIESAVLRGQDNLLQAQPLDTLHPALRLVGEVESVNVDMVQEVLDRDSIAIVSPLGCSVKDKDQILNINADYAAAAIAREMGAEVLFLLTSVPGVYDHSGELLAELGKDKYQELRRAGVVSNGMIPKIESALKARDGGVDQCRIVEFKDVNPVSYFLNGGKEGTRVVG